jgi:hypothetical protein
MDEIQELEYVFTKQLRKAVRSDFADGNDVKHSTYYLRSPNTGIFEGPYILWPGYSDLKRFGGYLKDGVVWVEIENLKTKI